ncbi:MAG: hypothetical protein KAR40_06070 [Candidatus Sabulitectum sp.]|nr:hypothetical protein [Candidatus Sabulitectum sp.]
MQWNIEDGTLEVGMPGGGVCLQIGQEILVRVQNEEAVQINNGRVVYASSAVGNVKRVKLANANDHDIAMKTVGVATEDILPGQFGYITYLGLVRDFDTSAFSDGQIVYLDTISGHLTGTPPTPPNTTVAVGIVVRPHATEGIMYAKISPVGYLKELSDVLVTSIANRDMVSWDAANSRWKNITLLSLNDTYVPYTGATANVDIGTYDMAVGDVLTITGQTNTEHLILKMAASQTVDQPPFQIQDSIGDEAFSIRLDNNTNLYMGHRVVGAGLTTGTFNTAVGSFSMLNNTTGNYSIAIGAYSLHTNNEGFQNIAIGPFSMNLNTAGYSNIAIGPFALRVNTTGYHNVFVGSNSAFSNTTGFQNVGVGESALYNNITGIQNTAVGYNVMNACTSGDKNVSMGVEALIAGTTCSSNTVVGTNALRTNTTSDFNVAIGSESGWYCTGANNVIVGSLAAKGASSFAMSNSVIIGYRAGLNNATSNRLYIANSDTSSPLIYGEFDNSLVRVNGNFIVGAAVAATDYSILFAGDSTNGCMTWMNSEGEFRISGNDAVNYTAIESDGTLRFAGTATTWDDVNIGGTTVGGPASGRPDIVTLLDNTGTDTGIYTLGFDTGEKVSGILEVPHWYKEGSDYQFHIHWQGDTVPSGTDKVQWELTYTLASNGGTLPPATTITIETDIDTQYKRYTSNFVNISGVDVGIGDQFMFTLERISASADEYSGDAKYHTLGIHFEKDGTGSRQMVIK